MNKRQVSVTPVQRKPGIANQQEAFSALRQHAAEAATLLRAMANENRLMILCALAGGALTVTELNERVDLSQSALSQHLAVLRRDGLVDTCRQAQTILYSLRGDIATRIIGLLREVYCPAD